MLIPKKMGEPFIPARACACTSQEYHDLLDDIEVHHNVDISMGVGRHNRLIPKTIRFPDGRRFRIRARAPIEAVFKAGIVVGRAVKGDSHD